MTKRGKAAALLAATGIFFSLGGAFAAQRGRSMGAGGDRQFMRMAAYTNIAEIRLGEQALQRAVNASVRDFAQMMIDDHNRANRELKAVAARMGTRLPNDTDAKHKAIASRLSPLSGAPYDRAYSREMVKGHMQAVAMFQNQLRRSRNPELRAWVARTLPALQEHLRRARAMAREVGVTVAGGDGMGRMMGAGHQGH